MRNRKIYINHEQDKAFLPNHLSYFLNNRARKNPLHYQNFDYRTDEAKRLHLWDQILVPSHNTKEFDERMK